MGEIISTFDDESTALKQIADVGFFSMTVDFPASARDVHWHDFDALVYVVEGQLILIDPETGKQEICDVGTKLTINRGLLHKEKTEGYRAIVGFSVNPAELSRPINKAPPVVL